MATFQQIRDALLDHLVAAGPYSRQEVSACSLDVMEGTSACAIVFLPGGDTTREETGMGATSGQDLMRWSINGSIFIKDTGDPALLGSLRWQGRAILVDLGRIDRTPGSVLLPIETVFVSHAHMDHFMGFDQMLRLLLARDGTLRLFGPGGIADLPRIFPGGIHGHIKSGSWPEPKIFRLIQEEGDIADSEMKKTFNMGIGYIIVVSKNQSDKTIQLLNQSGYKAFIIGNTEKGGKGVQYY